MTIRLKNRKNRRCVTVVATRSSWCVPLTTFVICVVLTLGSSAAEPPITAIAFAPDGESVVACSQRGVHVIGWPELDVEKTLKVAAHNLHDVAFSPSGDRLAVAGGTPAEEGTVEVFSWPAAQSVFVFDQHFDSVMAIAWRDNETIASASLDHSIILWDATSGSKLQQFDGHSRGVAALAFLQNQGALVSAGIDQSLRVWNLESGQLTRSLNIHTRSIHDIDVRPGDRALPMIASASEDRTVRMWQPTIGRMVRFARLESKPLDAQWLPDGSRVAVSCTDGKVRLIDPDTIQVTDDLPAVEGWAYSIAVHPTGNSILVGGGNGQLRRIDLDSGK